MTIQIGSYNFEGPYLAMRELFAKSGVYVILGKTPRGTWDVVDVGESENLRARVENHDRRGCWLRCGHEQLAYAALYVPELERMRVEDALRARYEPPCGER